MAKTCCFPGCSAIPSHRCDNCGGHVCVDHVRDDGRYLLCLTCEPEPVRIPLGGGCMVRVLKCGASVYGDPDARAEELMFLNPGSEVEAVEEVGGFYHVVTGEGEGYISKLSAELAGVSGKTALVAEENVEPQAEALADSGIQEKGALKIHCTNCGQPLENETRFCAGCGSPAMAATAAAPAFCIGCGASIP